MITDFIRDNSKTLKKLEKRLDKLLGKWYYLYTRLYKCKQMGEEMSEKVKPFYSSKEVADILGVSKLTLLRWEKRGEVPQARRDMHAYRIYTYEDILKLQEITGRKVESEEDSSKPGYKGEE